LERRGFSSSLGVLKAAEGGKSSMKQFINVFLAFLGIGFIVAAFKTRGFVSRSWNGSGPIHPITTIGRVIIFLTGLAALLAAVGIISK
jgi:hypothetical protein